MQTQCFSKKNILHILHIFFILSSWCICDVWRVKRGSSRVLQPKSWSYLCI